MENQKQLNSSVKWWLIIGLFMIFFQILLGGITRLTGSGLSITKWDIITGSIPPFSESSWNAEFDLYKKTPQYQHINQGMTLKEFKFIYFWEFIHRLWARTMGFVFIIPLLFFIYKKYIDKNLARQLFNVFILAALVASVGWIMVASGLINRPWVNAYKLSFHLILAVTLFSYLLWIVLSVSFKSLDLSSTSNFQSPVFFLVVLVFMQIFLGGMMSGMKASLMYPTWPKIGTEYIPSILLESKHWLINNLFFYEKNVFMPTFIHFLHRSLAYVIFIYASYLTYSIIMKDKNKILTLTCYILISLLILQVLLGILTLLNSTGSIPLLLGVLHQAIGILLLGSCITLYYLIKKRAFLNVNNSVS
ncbi:MAG TPA: COX15/CtaA family protein [Saprospiraceae bacterium]|nr:COX15/CtaA family protein [Saprospiraceae bacterium]